MDRATLYTVVIVLAVAIIIAAVALVAIAIGRRLDRRRAGGYPGAPHLPPPPPGMPGAYGPAPRAESGGGVSPVVVVLVAIGLLWYFLVYDTPAGRCGRGDLGACLVYEAQQLQRQQPTRRP